MIELFAFLQMLSTPKFNKFSYYITALKLTCHLGQSNIFEQIIITFYFFFLQTPIQYLFNVHLIIGIIHLILYYLLHHY